MADASPRNQRHRQSNNRREHTDRGVCPFSSEMLVRLSTAVQSVTESSLCQPGPALKSGYARKFRLQLYNQARRWFDSGRPAPVLLIGRDPQNRRASPILGSGEFYSAEISEHESPALGLVAAGLTPRRLGRLLRRAAGTPIGG